MADSVACQVAALPPAWTRDHCNMKGDTRQAALEGADHMAEASLNHADHMTKASRKHVHHMDEAAPEGAGTGHTDEAALEHVGHTDEGHDALPDDTDTGGAGGAPLPPGARCLPPRDWGPHHSGPERGLAGAEGGTGGTQGQERRHNFCLLAVLYS